MKAHERVLPWLPVVAAVALGALLWLGYSVVQDRWHERVEAELQAVLDREVAAVRAIGQRRSLHPKGFGETGDSFLFDRNAHILARGRTTASTDVGELRNPGGDTTTGFESRRPRAAQPLTVMAADAVEGRSGLNLDGYRDFRGVPVVGAWRWLPELKRGVAVELAMSEAYRGIYSLYFAMLIGLALLIAAAAGGFAYGRVIVAWRRQIRRTQRLGQYTLESKIGEGGMGKVYRARHALLRRPTAIKLIRRGERDEGAIVRFEREVQYTSELTHPNTIAIYDYGRTPNGTFYFAMEYLDGFDLNRLVDISGPLPEERAIFLLDQICGSLAEAHETGLVHRDIKPGNIMVCERGGSPDFIKVLDFGLARSVGHASDTEVTQTTSITGTPHYMSPESIEDAAAVDARSDLYAVGALAFYLLTGETVFKGKSPMSIYGSHLREPPQPPSERVDKPFDPALEALILRCLAKDRDQRPQTARQLRAELAECSGAGSWTEADATRWWDEHGDAAANKGPATDSGDPRSVIVDVMTRVASGRGGKR